MSKQTLASLAFFLAASLFAQTSLLAQAQYQSRTWTAKNGKKVEATFKSFTENRADLETEDGRSISVPVMSFAATDQAWLKHIVAARKQSEGVRSADPAVSRTAIRTMASQGEPGPIELELAFKDWYEERFEPLIDEPPTVGLKKPEPKACEAFFERQAEMLAMAKEIDKSKVPAMRQGYRELDALYQKALESMADFGDIPDTRAELDLFSERVQEHAPLFHQDIWPKLTGLSETLKFLQTAGKPVDGRKAVGKAPTTPTARFEWHYRRARAIDADNEVSAKGDETTHGMDGDELANAQRVNHYRELLGLQPYRFAAPLVKTARMHSGDMVQHKFFSHTSPVRGRKTAVDRTKLNGYKPPYVGENILWGSNTNEEKAFWRWFESPPHHGNLIGDYTEIGVGRYQTHWTQVFGRP